MTSTAISAQGSILQIATGSGGVKTITAVAVGFPTILTATAHGFSNGDVVALAALSGADAAALNGLSLTVQNKTTNTFAVAVDTTGKTLTAGSGSATPTTYTAIGNIKSFQNFDGAASEVDRTNLNSTAKEIILGLVDNGHVNFDMDADLADAGQAALRARQISGALTNFKFILPAGSPSTASYTAYVKKITMQGGVDQVIKSSVETRISGSVTWA